MKDSMVVTYYDRSWRVWVACRQDGNGNQVGEAGYGTSKDAAVRECEELNQEDNMTTTYQQNERAAVTLNDRYQIYLACANDGRGYDITRQGELLKTFDEWLNS